jgi:hypothetical protein
MAELPCMNHCGRRRRYRSQYCLPCRQEATKAYNRARGLKYRALVLSETDEEVNRKLAIVDAENRQGRQRWDPNAPTV